MGASTPPPVVPDNLIHRDPVELAYTAAYTSILKSAKAGEVEFPEMMCDSLIIEWTTPVNFDPTDGSEYVNTAEGTPQQPTGLHTVARFSRRTDAPTLGGSPAPQSSAPSAPVAGPPVVVP